MSDCSLLHCWTFQTKKCCVRMHASMSAEKEILFELQHTTFVLISFFQLCVVLTLDICSDMIMKPQPDGTICDNQSSRSEHWPMIDRLLPPRLICANLHYQLSAFTHLWTDRQIRAHHGFIITDSINTLACKYSLICNYCLSTWGQVSLAPSF